MLPQATRLKPGELEDQLERALLRYLQEVPFLQVEEIRRREAINGRQIDLLVGLRLPDGARQVLVGEVKSSGEPRFVRAALDHLFYVSHRSCPGAYGMLLAPYVSPDAAAICEEDGFGYVDLAGNCFLSFGQVYVRREGRLNVHTQKRPLRSLFSPKAERVLRVLLNGPLVSWKLQTLAREAGVSLGQAYNVKEGLLNRERARMDSRGVRLTEPERLLQEWASHYDFERSRKHSYHSLLQVDEIETRLAECCGRGGLTYTFTGFSGAARLAPHLRYQRVHTYVEPAARERLAEALALRPVTTGANVFLLEPYDEGVYYGARESGGMCVVSPVQLYLDLCTLPGRAEDAAEYLLDNVLRKQW